MIGMDAVIIAAELASRPTFTCGEEPSNANITSGQTQVSNPAAGGTPATAARPIASGIAVTVTSAPALASLAKSPGLMRLKREGDVGGTHHKITVATAKHKMSTPVPERPLGRRMISQVLQLD